MCIWLLPLFIHPRKLPGTNLLIIWIGHSCQTEGIYSRFVISHTTPPSAPCLHIFLASCYCDDYHHHKNIVSWSFLSQSWDVRSWLTEPSTVQARSPFSHQHKSPCRRGQRWRFFYSNRSWFVSIWSLSFYLQFDILCVHLPCTGKESAEIVNDSFLLCGMNTVAYPSGPLKCARFVHWGCQVPAAVSHSRWCL